MTTISIETPPIFEVTSRVRLNQSEMPEFRRTEENILLMIKHNLQRQDIVLGIDSELSRLFMNIMSPYLNKCNDEDHLAVTMNFEQLTVPIFIFSKKANFDSSALLKQLYAIAQSKKGNFLSGQLYVKVAIIRASSRPQMSGNGRHGKKSGAPRSLDEQSYLKNSVIQIENKDNSCGFRAIAVGMHFHLKVLVNAQPEDEDISGDVLEDLSSYNRSTRQSFSTIQEINKKWKNMTNPNCKLQRSC